LDLVVYNPNNGEIVGHIPNDQNINKVFYYYPNEFREMLKTIPYRKPINPLEQKVVNGKIIQREGIEITEIHQFGRILTEEERILEKLKPSTEEIEEAEMTIKILSLIQEVL
jgi:hypothetical protein